MHTRGDLAQAIRDEMNNLIQSLDTLDGYGIDESVLSTAEARLKMVTFQGKLNELVPENESFSG